MSADSPTLHPHLNVATLRQLYKQRRSEEIGSTGLVRYGDTVDEEWLHQLRGVRGVRIFREMQDNDATIGASLYSISSLIRQVDWTVQRAHEGKGAEEAAVFLEECLVDMSHTMADFWAEVLSMLPFGWSYFEKVFKTRDGRHPLDPTRNSRFDDGRIGWREIAIRAQETLDGWEFDDDGGIRGMYQSAAPNFNRVFLPIEKCLLFRPDLNKNNPEGRSLLRNAFRSWFFLKRIQEIEAIGIERDLVGLPVIELPHAYMNPKDPEKTKARNAYATLLQQIRRNQHEGVLFPSETTEDGTPSGYKLRLLSTGGSRQMDPGAVALRYQKDISMTLLTQFLFLGMDKAGSFALSSNMTDLFAVSLGAILDTLEETFDRFAVRELMSINGFPEEDWPRYEHGDVERIDAEKLANTLKTLSDGGFLTPDPSLEEHIRGEMQVPPMPEDADVGDDDEEALMNATPPPAVSSTPDVSNAEDTEAEDVDDAMEGVSRPEQDVTA
ncbi:MAG: hypothetical protein B7733_21905 [Myxococcales bacterium FL481]|nr:MAG: hypothetical protein B7733_21905 [Myxococcales bacterium FL481]